MGSNAGVPRWKPPTTAIHPIDARELAGVADGVDHPGVAAARDDDQALAAHVGHQRLIVVDERVRLPLPVAEGLLDGESPARTPWCVRSPPSPGGRRPAAIEGSPALDHREARGADLLLAGRGQLLGLPPGDGDPPLAARHRDERPAAAAAGVASPARSGPSCGRNGRG